MPILPHETPSGPRLCHRCRYVAFDFMHTMNNLCTGVWGIWSRTRLMSRAELGKQVASLFRLSPVDALDESEWGDGDDAVALRLKVPPQPPLAKARAPQCTLTRALRRD